MSQPVPVATMEQASPVHAVPMPAGAPSRKQPAESASSAESPNACDFLESLTQCVLEVLAGVRDIDQLARWVSDDVYKNLSKRVVLSSRARQVKGQRSMRPSFSIGRTLLSEPLPGVIEAVVIVHGKARTRAVALRIERFGARWRASAINVL
jgi:hypothetical protein